ncbi:uncharacterized protein LOC129941031 [Eupeodes corollae]|uniref:uncharacterized protein LOC129941031 n=1 Tax=Eupeodes corollae TaxID=290404 RepID=UPI002490A12E|nr:uncharacterized protein LOC129941031 [Eupeodes corollae]XP_055905546.1 uncharacterized protein LOC129941031 [Eupeodes corollae]XP_055905548.1 uncharacterized protein LOC129941031 [Eupeodes corollae]
MQKFIKLNNHEPNNVEEEQTSSTSLHASKVKLVGYLKKKRTKVGGWRKMWFVLQNQLLLSYPSKEDYDKKLVSFKDVLNLVPGTVVRPLGGYRFAIQTTSESVFIFRCDDNKTYMEWITALVDSLSIGSKAVKQQNKDGYGAGGMVKRPLQGSHSCSSLVRSKKNKAVHIPIVHGTARILNRTGLSENDLRAFSLRDTNERSTTSSSSSNHFCLHETQFLLQNQSNEVSRINRMFCGSASSEVDTSLTIYPAIAGSSDKGFAQQSLTHQPLKKSTTMKAKLSGLKGNHRQFESESGEVNQKSVINRKIHDLLNYIKTDNFTMIEDKLSESDFASDINANRRCDLKRVLMDNERKKKNHSDNTAIAAAINGRRNTRIEDQVQRLSLQGSSAFKIDDKKNISMDEEVNCLRLSSTIRKEEEEQEKQREEKEEEERRSPFSRHHHRHHGKRPEAGCSSSSAGSGSGSGSGCSSSTLSSSSSSGRTIESLSHHNDKDNNGSEISEDIAKKNEPIYAVVDLKNKYEHRARIRQRHEMEEKRKSRLGQMNDLDEVTTDYEEVFDFPHEALEDNNYIRHCYDDENIYEPINIPDPPFRDHKHRNVVWKYISRLNIDTLFEMARNRKKSVKPPSEHTSPFANIKQKIGHHRKSLRIRMIKFYASRENPQVSQEIVEQISNDDKIDQCQK